MSETQSETRKLKELRQEARKLLREIALLHALPDRDKAFLKALATEENPNPLIMIQSATSAIALINNKPKEAA